MLTNESKTLGVAVNKSGTNAPRSAQLDAYKAAMRGGFAFGVIRALLAAVFLRHVGIVGHRKEDDTPDEERTAHVPESEGQKEEKSTEERQ